MFLMMRFVKSVKELQIVVFAVLFTMVFACNLVYAQSPIKIGLVVPLQGPLAPVGKDFLAGAQVAIDSANKTAVKAKKAKVKFELVVESDEVDHPNYKMWLTNLAQKFEQNKVLAVIGHLSTQSSWQASKVYQAKAIPFISPLSSYQGLTLQGLNSAYTPTSSLLVNSTGNITASTIGSSTFRLVPTDAQLANAMAQQLLQNPKPQKIVVWHDGSVYGQTLTKQFTQSLLPHSRIQLLTLQLKQQVNGIFNDEFDLHHQLQFLAAACKHQKPCNESIKSPKIDAIFMGATQDKVIALKRLMNQLSVPIPLYAVSIASQEYIDWTDSSAVLPMAKISTLASDVSIESWPMLPLVRTKNVLAKHLEQQNHTMLTYAPYGFDAVNLVIAAYIKSSTKTNSHFLKQLKEVQYQGLTGTISFDANGDLKQPRFYFYQLKNNHWVKL